MLTLPGTLRCAESDFHLTILAYILLIPLALSSCSKKVVIKSTPETFKYSSVGEVHWISGTPQSKFKNNIFYCEIFFEDLEKKDMIRLEVISSYMKPRVLNNTMCLDKAIVYDGLAYYDNKLGEFCGNEVPIFESSGSSLLLIIKSYHRSLADTEYYGFLLNYSRINRDNQGSLHQTQPSLALSTCPKRVAVKSTPETLNYTSVWKFHWISWKEQSLLKNNNLYCDIFFQDLQKNDTIRLEVISSYMKPRMLNNNLCLDKATVYDGLSHLDKKLGDFCGNEVPVFESSGSSLLLVIETYNRSLTEYIGFLLSYSRIYNVHTILKSWSPQPVIVEEAEILRFDYLPSLGENKDSFRQSSLGSSTIILVTVSGVIFFCFLLVIIYRQCKNAHTVRRTLTISRNVPAHLSVPLTTVQDQASLAVPFHRQNQPFHNNSLPDTFTNANTISRPGSSQGSQRSGAGGDVCSDDGPPPSYEDAVLGNMQLAS